MNHTLMYVSNAIVTLSRSRYRSRHKECARQRICRPDLYRPLPKKFQMGVGAHDHDISHPTAQLTTKCSRGVYDTFIFTHFTRMRFRQRIQDHLTLSTKRDIATHKAFLIRATINVILIWLFWKGIMLLLFLLTTSLIVDIAASTVVSEGNGYEGITRAVRLAELHLIRLIMAILAEFWGIVCTTLMACTFQTLRPSKKL